MKKIAVLTCCLCSIFFVRATLYGEDIQEGKSSQNTQMEEKGLSRGPRGHRGPKGHHGDRGKHGNIGPTGPVGPTGIIDVALAYGSETESVILNGKSSLSGFSVNDLQLAPLWNVKPSPITTSDYSFTPYAPGLPKPTGAYFTIHTAGQYMFQYGLVGVPGGVVVPPFNSLEKDYTNLQVTKDSGTGFVTNVTLGPPKAQTWIALQVEHSDSSVDIHGATPLSLTFTENNSTFSSLGVSFSKYILSGFGQHPLTLASGDKVSLQVYIGVEDTVEAAPARLLLISPKSIETFASQATLSITKLPS